MGAKVRKEEWRFLWCGEVFEYKHPKVYKYGGSYKQLLLPGQKNGETKKLIGR
jgi:uncharacterized protein YjlB